MKKLFALATVAVVASASVASAQAVTPLDNNTSTQVTFPLPLLIGGIGVAFAIAGSTTSGTN